MNKFEKSKPPISAINNKTDTCGNDKKSKIRVEIKPLVKKRGVYVENKSTELSIKANMDRKYKTGKHLPRPGKKRFLDSVFNILSKSTAGTQYPDSEDIKNFDKTKSGNIKNYDSNTDAKINITKRKPKYKSKVLNENKDEGELVVLQSKKNISDSPSIYSERSRDPETVKWSDFLPPLVHRTDSSRTDFGSSKDKEPTKQRRVTLADNREPVTLVNSEAKKHDKKLYKFFVDVLQNTLNECEKQTLSNVHNITCAKFSNTVFEMDESLAEELEIKVTKNIENFNYSNHNFNRFLCTPHDYEINNYDSAKVKRKLFNYSALSATTNTNKTKRQFKSESFQYNKKTPIPFANNLIFQKSPSTYKRPLKKEYKRNFLNILKKELKMDNKTYEEPQNLYQALKTIARKKRSHQKSISFNEPSKSDEDDSKCVFKRRRVLSSRPKLKKKTNERLGSKSVLIHDSAAYSSKKITTESEFESTHSILVYGYDYESPKNIRECVKTENRNYSGSSKSELNDEDSLYFNNSSMTISSVKERKE